MDETDKKIVKMLEKDARRPFTDIAEELGVSEATVRKRVTKLEGESVIKGYTVVIDPESMGYSTVTLLGLDVEPENLIETAQKIGRMDEVNKVYTCAGDHMIMAEIWTEDNQKLGKIMSEKIGEIEGVKNLCPAIVLEEIKG